MARDHRKFRIQLAKQRESTMDLIEQGRILEPTSKSLVNLNRGLSNVKSLLKLTGLLIASLVVSVALTTSSVRIKESLPMRYDQVSMRKYNLFVVM